MLNKLARDHAALAKKVAERPPVTVRSATTKAPIQQTVFSLRTPPGKRAITMEIKSLSAVGGLVHPGDFVDILARLAVPEDDDPLNKTKDEIISVLFQNIQVLAVGINYDPVGTVPTYALQQEAKTLHVTFCRLYTSPRLRDS